MATQKLVVALCIFSCFLTFFAALTEARPRAHAPSGESETNANLTETNGNGNGSDTTRGLLLANIHNGDPKDAQVWPGGKVYWRFADKRLSSSQRQGIMTAMATIQMGTDSCIQFIQDSKAARKKGVIEFLAFEPSGESSCVSSSLGYEPDSTQYIVISAGECDYIPGNYAGSVVHEIMHALGYIHEFARSDRSKWISFRPGTKYVDYVQDSKTYGIPFNFQSIMNYDFSDAVIEKPNHPPTLGMPRNMGQECKLSLGDLRMLEEGYYLECRADKKKRVYTASYRIPGTMCGAKVPPTGEDFDDSKLRRIPSTGQE